MDWHQAIGFLRSTREAGVLVTLTEARGHTPRAAGAKMVVAAQRSWDSVGGGNLEETVIAQAREMLRDGVTAPRSLSFRLNDKSPTSYGQQCCGGEVSVMLDPIAVVPAVAIFGMGHVGWELARILDRQHLDLHVVDSRADQISDAHVSRLDGPAHVTAHHSPVPELVLGQIPSGTHVLVMTHDHSEDIALIDSALRHSHLGSIGLIGSSAKWSRFRGRLADEGHTDDDLARVITPIGLPNLDGKEPAVIAVSVAAATLQRIAANRPPVESART
ncbi:xanthine dehydrogenase accessory protein XdhC [Demetria terragena]|uniref:xanthine dehydrogenase accessory protein XdhC n=1 Tax=Demetria terragena TaxID=63959 RepID=UPI00035D4E05|nr:xanthine dehydrogenase accessory protein XdhC [Demetria terragena]